MDRLVPGVEGERLTESVADARTCGRTGRLPTLKPASQLAAPQTQISVLPSGLRVISQETYGQAATIGVFIDAGSRVEDGASPPPRTLAPPRTG